MDAALAAGLGAYAGEYFLPGQNKVLVHVGAGLLAEFVYGGYATSKELTGTTDVSKSLGFAVEDASYIFRDVESMTWPLVFTGLSYYFADKLDSPLKVIAGTGAFSFAGHKVREALKQESGKQFIFHYRSNAKGSPDYKPK